MKIMQKWPKQKSSHGKRWVKKKKKHREIEGQKIKNYVFVAMNFPNDFIHSFFGRDKEIKWRQFSDRKFPIELKFSLIEEDLWERKDFWICDKFLAVCSIDILREVLELWWSEVSFFKNCWLYTWIFERSETIENFF